MLEHLKRVEAREGAGDEQVHDDLLTARAIWMILKEKMLHVSVPYARSIQFSSAGNRRNPGFLFDLIKCHALLFRFQREESSGGIRATLDDFAAAARLYGAINGEAGGQETKLTKNEAAALATVVTMGWGQFTVRMLQEALGLSYQQTYRILHGYVSRGATYSGLLEKCPAVSYVDAQFTEDACGCTVRRREHLFSFDLGVYRQWSRGAEVWLDDGEDRDGGPDPGDSFSITAGLEQDSSRCCKDRSPPNDAETEYTGTERDASLSIDRNIQQTRDPHSSTGSRVFGGVRVCESRDAVTTTPMPLETPPNGDSRNVIRPFDFNGLRNLQKITERRGGLLETGAGGTVPLPGVLNPGMFERVRAEIGRCDICDNGKAVYRSREAQTNICEGCYARLVRERNGRAGVRCG
ncbi:hypothetical protein HL657_10980 [Methanoculleus sp. YWC-01]|uniref:Uncharacterized protein n=1 Tax=Methanoculleus nereidis TaxID=2735141 RepID=A0ABU3Z4E5_9EURY|nr:hypothetical protein [Methanoculleus sp. YWC-01]MDV4343677.1 hypothetical protein [Methanoculleus sp. YWC-01]